MNNSLQLDLVFSALGDSTRRNILARLVGGDKSVGELAQHYDISAPAVSKHIAILEKSQLISIVKNGRNKFASIEFEALRSAQIWLEAIDDDVDIWAQLALNVKDVDCDDAQ